LRGAFFGRFVKTIAKDFDLCISSYNFAEFGQPSIQFIADFSWDDQTRREFDAVSPGLRGLLQGPNLARRAYLAATDVIRGGHHDLHKHVDDIIIANSHWTADLLMSRHGLPARIISPPVHTPPQRETKRSKDFVMLGRISPEKRLIEAMNILRRVRERGHRFNFHIIGPLEKSAYCNQVREHAQMFGDWVRLRGGIYGDEKFEELGRHSFGLHVRRREAFGIAVAEMLKMGLVPFIPAGSAPAGIVDDERVAFENDEHAVDVIDRVLRDPEQLASIRQHLVGRANLFSTERFVREVGGVIEDALCEQRSHFSIG
jgi:glycosyltransferase involved in cell wall biosynthesis